MPTHPKATKRSAISMQKRTKLLSDSNLAYLDHTLPPLGLFLQSKLIFLSLSQTNLFGIKRDSPRVKMIKIQKLPLFLIIINSPHKRPNFDNKSILTNQILTLLFSKFSS